MQFCSTLVVECEKYPIVHRRDYDEFKTVDFERYKKKRGKELLRNEDLLPCTVCGSKNVTHHDSTTPGFDWTRFVQCDDCKSRTSSYGSMVSAEYVWNVLFQKYRIHDDETLMREAYSLGIVGGGKRRMNARRIVFSTEMVKAILAGRKTQTRRVVKRQPKNADFTIGFYTLPMIDISGHKYQGDTRFGLSHGDDILWWCCPYGAPGDKLWVAEEWLLDNSRYFYKSDKHIWDDKNFDKWKSAESMPRCASRLTLEITDVRCERLQSISAEDCISEGCESIGKYIELWDKLNAKRGFDWESNPFVWVITFKQVKGEQT
jgi:hypothetical protein